VRRPGFGGLAPQNRTEYGRSSTAECRSPKPRRGFDPCCPCKVRRSRFTSWADRISPLPFSGAGETRHPFFQLLIQDASIYQRGGESSRGNRGRARNVLRFVV